MKRPNPFFPLPEWARNDLEHVRQLLGAHSLQQSTPMLGLHLDQDFAEHVWMPLEENPTDIRLVGRSQVS